MTPEQLIAGLDGQVPIVLLPIRLETRFSSDRRTLRIRIFPDQIHKDDHEPELTDAELAVGQRYWRSRWAAGADAAEARAAWEAIAATHRPPRARWIVAVTTPVNVATLGQGEPQFPDVARKDGVWTRTARAALLPKQWVALGYRGDREVFRVWSATVASTVAMGPSPETSAPPSTPDGELPIDDGMRWMVDYRRAFDDGMAITIADSDVSGGLAEGVDTLIVTGLDWSLDPAEGASALRERLASAAASDGVSFLPAGTPTNNTIENSTRMLTDTAQFDPFDAPAAPPTDGSGVLAERALGLDPNSALTIAPHAVDRADIAASHMATALWPTTWGYFLDQMMRPLVGDATIAAVRDHFRSWVRGRGPLPTLRVANQPYGMLPVVAPAAVSGGDTVEAQIKSVIGSIRPVWTRAAASAPGMGTTTTPDRDLVTLLRMTPRSTSFRSRRVAGAAVVAASQGFETLAPFQEIGATTLLSLAGIAGHPRLVDSTLDTAQRLLPVPLIARGDLSETAPLNPNYVADIASSLARRGGFAGIVTKPAPPQSILEALLQQSAQIAVVEASTRLVTAFEVAQGTLATMPAHVVVRERELHGIDPADTTSAIAPTQPSLLDSLTDSLEVADLTVLQVSGSDTLADHLATQNIGDLTNVAATKQLGEMRESLEFLGTLPAAELGRLAAETLDCCSHRLDAWLTSLATRRLARVRETVSGSYVGAFGWLEDVRPRTDTTSFGYVHAPSVGHAATAAILRSGHLAHRAEDAGAFAVDLSSRRVQSALELLDGMRQGQPIGALLGYRLERALRERRLELGGYVLRVAPDGAAGHRDRRLRRQQAPRGNRSQGCRRRAGAP